MRLGVLQPGGFRARGRAQPRRFLDLSLKSCLQCSQSGCEAVHPLQLWIITGPMQVRHINTPSPTSHTRTHTYTKGTNAILQPTGLKSSIVFDTANHFHAGDACQPTALTRQPPGDQSPVRVHLADSRTSTFADPWGGKKTERGLKRTINFMELHSV